MSAGRRLVGSRGDIRASEGATLGEGAWEGAGGRASNLGEIEVN